MKQKLKTKNCIILCFFLVLSFSCKKEEPNSVIKDNFAGYVQKGPFINGSSLTIQELNEKLQQTGRTYNTTIANNLGKYELENIELISNYVSIKADGFYFNENIGENSSAQLTLSAIAEITDESTVNVNILTHLTKSRIEYLINQKKFSYQNAKKRAIKDVLTIFSIQKNDIENPENLNIINEGDDNAILVAISIIIQGYRTTADMSELIANIITDIKEDGVLNDNTLGSSLIDEAKLLNLNTIRNNIEKRYSELDTTITLSSFENYVNFFLENTKYEPTKLTYPDSSNYGINILNENVTTVKPSEEVYEDIKYSMAANLPKGTTLKIVLKGGLWLTRILPEGPVNWTISSYLNQQQTFTVIESGTNCDLNIRFPNSGSITIEYYENNADVPTKVKELIVAN
jgi:hypothetical protein